MNAIWKAWDQACTAALNRAKLAGKSGSLGDDPETNRPVTMVNLKAAMPACAADYRRMRPTAQLLQALHATVVSNSHDMDHNTIIDLFSLAMGVGFEAGQAYHLLDLQRRLDEVCGQDESRESSMEEYTDPAGRDLEPALNRYIQQVDRLPAMAAAEYQHLMEQGRNQAKPVGPQEFESLVQSILSVDPELTRQQALETVLSALQEGGRELDLGVGTDPVCKVCSVASRGNIGGWLMVVSRDQQEITYYCPQHSRNSDPEAVAIRMDPNL